MCFSSSAEAHSRLIHRASRLNHGRHANYQRRFAEEAEDCVPKCSFTLPVVAFTAEPIARVAAELDELGTVCERLAEGSGSPSTSPTSYSAVENSHRVRSQPC
jgi:hypothetical protein